MGKAATANLAIVMNDMLIARHHRCQIQEILARMHHVAFVLLFMVMCTANPFSSIQAAELTVTTTTTTVSPGEILDLQLVLDLGTDEVVGGAFDLDFDPAVLSFESFTFDPAMDSRDLAFDTADSTIAGRFTIGFGRITGFTGVLPLGTVRLLVAGHLGQDLGRVRGLELLDQVGGLGLGHVLEHVRRGTRFEHEHQPALVGPISETLYGFPKPGYEEHQCMQVGGALHGD